MKLVELFCGCGGFSLGAHRAGFEVAAAYDLDKTLTSSYPLNFPTTALFHRDVSELGGKEIAAAVEGEILGVFGGPPCQGFSDIGRRQKDDPRRSLLRDFFRIVSEVEPRFFIMENVRGLTYHDALPVLTDALKLVKDRYHVLGPHIWDASEFGAPTRRNRMFVIGIRRDAGAPMDVKAVEARKRPLVTVRDAIGDLTGATELPERSDLPGFDRWQLDPSQRASTYARGMRSEDASFTGHRATAHTKLVVERFSKVGQGEVDKVGRHPRLDWSGLCPTLRAGTGADKGSYQSVRPIHPREDRVITVREAARLQGFPDWHIFHPTVWHSFRMIGNSVSPIIAEAIFGAVRTHLAIGPGVGGSNSKEGARVPEPAE